MTIDEAYKDVKPLICHTVQRFQKRYGGDREELLAEANYHFVQAYHSYRPGVGKLSGWVQYKVYRELLETVRTQARRNACISRQEVMMETVAQKRERLLPTLLNEVSDDARAVLSLTIGPHLHTLMKERSSPQQKRRLLGHFLLQLGWSGRQIVDTFREIQEALS